MKLLALVVACSLISLSAYSQTCFDAKRVFAAKAADLLQTQCKQQLNIRIDKAGAIKKLSDEASLSVDCFAACKKNEDSTLCVNRFTDDVVSGFMNSSDMTKACNFFK